MNLRAPAYPLVTVDPYFSVWSPADRLTDTTTVHWTGKPNTMLGIADEERTEKCLAAVDKYLDDAIMYNMQSVHLIHGKGTGALKNALWQFLRGDKRIASFRIGKYGEGDGGVTVVELK